MNFGNIVIMMSKLAKNQKTLRSRVNFNADIPKKPLEVEHSNILNKQQQLILDIFNKQIQAAAEKDKKAN